MYKNYVKKKMIIKNTNLVTENTCSSKISNYEAQDKIVVDFIETILFPVSNYISLFQGTLHLPKFTIS